MTHPHPPADDIHPQFVRILFAVIILLFLFRNVPWRLDDLDQAKQAFTSLEMVEEDNWLFQHTPGGRVATKPPLAGWVSAALYFMMGGNWWEGAWRLPSLVCAIGLLAMLWRAGTHLLGGNNIGGLLAAGAFGLNSFTPRLATLVRTDMMLAFLIFLIGWMIWKKVRHRDFWTTHDRVLLCLLVLATMLVKGPIVYAFLLSGLALYSLFVRRFKIQNFAWAGAWPWLAPLLAFGGWVWLGASQSQDFYDQVVLKEFLGRFDLSDDPVHQHRPVYLYIAQLLPRFLPWSLLLIALLLVKKVRAAFRKDPELLWLACWAVGGLLVMSLVPSKRFDRILPVVPPLCLLMAACARHLPHFELRGQPIGRLSILIALLSCVTSLGYAGFHVVRDVHGGAGSLARFGAQVRKNVTGRKDRLAVVSAKDDRLLLYTRKTRFTRTEDAIAMWRFGRIDWLVMPRPLFKKHRPQLGQLAIRSEVGPSRERSTSYIFIERLGPPEKLQTIRSTDRSPHEN